MKALFLDRDGTIIEDANYTKNPDDVKLIPFALEGLHLMSEKGYPLFVISNQSGVGRGIMTTAEFWGVHQRFGQYLKDAKVAIEEFMYCFHHPDDDCACRKPKTGLIPRRHQNQDLDLASCCVIGDREFDLFLADNLGAKGILVLSGAGKLTRETLTKEGKIDRYQVFDNLLEVARSLPRNA